MSAWPVTHNKNLSLPRLPDQPLLHLPLLPSQPCSPGSGGSSPAQRYLCVSPLTGTASTSIRAVWGGPVLWDARCCAAGTGQYQTARAAAPLCAQPAPASPWCRHLVGRAAGPWGLGAPAVPRKVSGQPKEGAGCRPAALGPVVLSRPLCQQELGEETGAKEMPRPPLLKER